MSEITLTDGTTISFDKAENKRYLITIKIPQMPKKIKLHVDKKVLNLLQFEIDDLLNA